MTSSSENKRLDRKREKQVKKITCKGMKRMKETIMNFLKQNSIDFVLIENGINVLYSNVNTDLFIFAKELNCKTELQNDFTMNIYW